MKILIAEDTRSIAAVLQARLMAYGHTVDLAENGQIACEKFIDLKPDLVLMDIEMPLMNGFEATNRIRAYESTQKWAWTPIIMLTASDVPENLVTAIEAGADDYLVKGLSESVLKAKMKAMERIASMSKQLSIANHQLEQQASRDGLTGLFNRRWMDLKSDSAWDECERLNQSFALLMLDVDNFKKYNDRYGHQAGDDCLRAVAKAIQITVDETNAEGLTQKVFAARYGGEEFAVVMPATSMQTTKLIADRVIDSIRKLAIPHELNAGWGIVTASIGGNCLDHASGNAAKLFRDADSALYNAKESGRNRVEFAN
jgi:diguanylate cyclase (GGDEF)-like protein